MTERDYIERAAKAPATTAILEKSGTEEPAARHPFLGSFLEVILKSGRFCKLRNGKLRVRRNVSAPGRIRTCDRETRNLPLTGSHRCSPNEL